MTGRWPQPAARPAASVAWERRSDWTSSMLTCSPTAGSSAATWKPPEPPHAGLASIRETWGLIWATGPSPPRHRRPLRHLPPPQFTPRWMAGCRFPMGLALLLLTHPAKRPVAPRTATRRPVLLAQEREFGSVTKSFTTPCAVTTTRRRSKRTFKRTKVAVPPRIAIAIRLSWQARLLPNVLPPSTHSSIIVWTLRMCHHQRRGRWVLTHYPGKVS